MSKYQNLRRTPFLEGIQPDHARYAETGEDFDSHVYGSREFRQAMWALTYDHEIDNYERADRSDARRPLELRDNPGEVAFDTPNQSMLLSNTLALRPDIAGSCPEVLLLRRTDPIVFMYEDFLVRCSNPFWLRISHHSDYVRYSLREVRMMGLPVPEGISHSRSHSQGVQVLVHQYRLVPPPEIAFDELLAQGDAYPCPLRIDMSGYPHDMLAAYNLAVPPERQKPAVRAAVELFANSK